jgi:hypothetical protein
MLSRSTLKKLIDFDLDTHLNPYIPPPTILFYLPKPLSHFLGHRSTSHSKLPSTVIYIWSFIGAFCGVALIEGVSITSPVFLHQNSPVIIASFGASAILLFQTIDSPLAQPRNFIFGHAISALIGVCITKLFEMNPDFENLRWVAGALSCGLASVAMGVTKTIHPPAGATALMSATQPTITIMGWWFIPLVLISSCLMLGATLVINNLHRHYPAYWWTPAPVGRRLTKEKPDILERKRSTSTDPELAIAGFAGQANPSRPVDDADESCEDVEKADASALEQAQSILITPRGLGVPEELRLSEEEEAMLRLLQQRLMRAYLG